MTAVIIALAILALPGPPAVAETHVVRSVSGQATWYGTGPGAGHAAAGSELRTGDWRGRHVRVCTGVRCLDVVIDDWCACKGARIIDLSDEDFAKLAPLSVGVISVTVRSAHGRTLVHKAPKAPKVLKLPETHALLGPIGTELYAL